MSKVTHGSLHMKGKMIVVFNNEPNREIECHIVKLTDGEYTISSDKKHITVFSAQHLLWNTDSITFTSDDTCSPVTISSK